METGVFVHQAVLKNKKRGGVWSLINRKASPTTLELEIDGQTTSDKSKIAPEFKDTFSKKMTLLSSRAPSQQNDITLKGSAD